MLDRLACFAKTNDVLNKHNMAELSRAGQRAMCKEECEGTELNCYLGANDGSDCVFGGLVFPSEPGYQCCRVKTDVRFIRTAHSILNYADEVADVGTAQARAALDDLLNSDGMQIPAATTCFTNQTLRATLFNDEGMARDLMNLLDKIIPTSAYAVAVGSADVIRAQPELRRRKPNIAYKISPRHEYHLPNEIFKLASHLRIRIPHLTRARLEVWIENALQWRQPRAQKARITVHTRLLDVKLNRQFFARIESYLASSMFRGTISVTFASGDALEDDVVRGTVLAPNALPVTYTLLQDPNKLEIEIDH